MSENTLYDKVWDIHKVCELPSGQSQMLIGRHLIHEVTSPQAFGMIKEGGGSVLFPNNTFATPDHIIPTEEQERPFKFDKAEAMLSALEGNVKAHHIPYFGLESGKQGIVHVVGPERGISQPGMTVACGDSHTSTHGAFGSLAFGIGTTEVRYILETGTLPLDKLKVRRINYDGKLQKGVYAKDVVLNIIRELGVKGGIGYVYEFAGSLLDSMTMEERMTICNMSIEGGARIGYVNPDETTFDFIKGREFAPSEENWDRAVEYWKSVASDKDATYDDIKNFDASKLTPMVTWGINPEQTLSIEDKLPTLDSMSEEQLGGAKEAFDYMGLKEGQSLSDIKIDVAFVGSCTNGRMSDLRETAKVLKGRKVSDSVKMLVVPGSQEIKIEAEKEGLDKIFTEAGAQWREAGCSMCLAMNPDKLVGTERSLSTSNRNFMGRQGSSKGRTHLGSPATVAASAITGVITDPREFV